MLYLRLFIEFFKTGLFAVGGGMATIPFLYRMADATGWFTVNDVANMIAVGESTPGPIGVNMATYVGFVTGMNANGTVGAVAGAIIATLGLITPSIIVILVIAAALKSFRDNRYVNQAFYGLRPASTGLIAAAGISVVVSNLFFAEEMAEGFCLDGINWKGWILAIVLWILTNKVAKTKKWHPIVFIAMSAVVGILFSMG
ncbi:MAG: chromate transporter [Lachnospiraceae bacterium]|nr:chromate transporter [Lachnospiraceae bacterium]